MEVVANEPSGASSLQTGDTTWETNVRCRKIWSQGKGGIGVLHAWSLDQSLRASVTRSDRPRPFLSRGSTRQHTTCGTTCSIGSHLLGPPLPCRQLRRTEWARPGHPWLALAARICESQGPGTHPQKKEKESSSWMAILAGLAPGAALVSGGEAPFRDRPVAMNDSP